MRAAQDMKEVRSTVVESESIHFFFSAAESATNSISEERKKKKKRFWGGQGRLGGAKGDWGGGIGKGPKPSELLVTTLKVVAASRDSIAATCAPEMS